MPLPGFRQKFFDFRAGAPSEPALASQALRAIFGVRSGKANRLSDKRMARASVCIAEEMMDTLSKIERSERMSLVRAKNTKPERLVRSVIRALGYRFTTHDRSLPGNPDFVFRTQRKVIFVHGCFWHRHACFNGVRLPKSRREFWEDKLQGNLRRDRRNHRLINKQGWRYMTIWECKMKHSADLVRRITRFLESS